MKYFTCLFETEYKNDLAQVTKFDLCDETLQHITGESVESFFNYIIQQKAITISFHDLKFYGSFIVHYMLTHGFTFSEYDNVIPKFHFTLLVSDPGEWYEIKIHTLKGIVTMIDSKKLLPFDILQIRKDFHIESTVTTEILSIATSELRNAGLNKLTIGACALDFYKKSNKYFNQLFPASAFDADMRQAFKGGWTYCNPKYQGEDINMGQVLDVNSLYPWVMSECPLPYGIPIFFNGKYEPDRDYPLYIQKIQCSFDIKPGYLPTVQIHDNPLFLATDYLESSEFETVTLCLSSVDLDLFLEHYDVYNLEYISGYKFKASTDLFKDYVAHWTEQKISAKQSNNYAMYIISKLMLNNLYGKFSVNPKGGHRVPVLNNGLVDYCKTQEDDDRMPLYIPVGIFVTAYGRLKTITAAQDNYDRFLYSDTDSIHLIGIEDADNVIIDDYMLGAFKQEAIFNKARYLHAKCYIEEIINTDTGELETKAVVAGLPADAKVNVTFDNFTNGTMYGGRKILQLVKGGAVYIDAPFQIRAI